MKGSEFRQIRLELGYETPSEFARAIGVSHMSVYNWEDGTTVIKKPTEMLMRLLRSASVKRRAEAGLFP